MERDTKIVLGSILILLISMSSFYFFDINNITGEAKTDDNTRQKETKFTLQNQKETKLRLSISEPNSEKRDDSKTCKTKTSSVLDCSFNKNLKQGETRTIEADLISNPNKLIITNLKLLKLNKFNKVVSIVKEKECNSVECSFMEKLSENGKYKIEASTKKSTSKIPTINNKITEPSKFASDIKITKSLSKITVNENEIITVTLKIDNNRDTELTGTLTDSVPDFIEVLPDELSIQSSNDLFNGKIFSITVLPKSSVERTYQLKFSYIPPQLWNKELSTGIADIVSNEGNKIQSNNPKVLFSKLVSSLVASQCDYDYVCDSGENYNTCFQDCTSGSSDGYCDGLQDKRCDADCNANTDADCRTAAPGSFVALTGRTVALPPAQGKRVPGTSEVPFGSSGSSSGGLSATGGSKPAGTPPVGTPISVLNAPAPSAPTSGTCGNGACGLDETCVNCAVDCGACPYGTSRGNLNVPCGAYYEQIEHWSGLFSYTEEEWSIGLKYDNLNIGHPLIKEKINQWVLRDHYMFEQVKNGIYDEAVKIIAFNVKNLYFQQDGVRYASTSCDPESGHDPTPDYALVQGASGNCVDWSALQVSLLRTLGVPANRVFMTCYNINYDPGHCVAVYISDSNSYNVLDYGMILPSTGNLGRLSCVDVDRSYWGNDLGTDWGMNGLSCEAVPRCGNGIIDSDEVCDFKAPRECTTSTGGGGFEECNIGCTKYSGYCRPTNNIPRPLLELHSVKLLVNNNYVIEIEYSQNDYINTPLRFTLIKVRNDVGNEGVRDFIESFSGENGDHLKVRFTSSRVANGQNYILCNGGGLQAFCTKEVTATLA